MKLPIPSAALAQHILVLGKTRSGKSSTLRVMVEQLLDDKKPVCIIDPKGDWWGIKSSANGKKAGYDVVIFGGTHADVPINAHSGKVVAELVATGNRPCLIDLGGWMVGERTKFFIDFASTLFTRTHGHRWLVVDECHNFAPQGKVMDPQAGMSLHWANRLASEGAGKGIVLMSASQRPQKVHKDYVTSHETLIAKRVIHPLDRDAMKEWIDGCGDPKKGKEVLDTLAGLQRSQGWVWSPEIDFGPKLVEFPLFATYDSFAVQTGKAGRKLKGWASVDLEDVKAKLAAVVEQEKANDPKELRTRLVEKDKEIKRLQGELTSKSTTKADPDAIKKAEERGFAQAEKKLKSAMRAYCNAEVVEVLTVLQRGFEEPLKRLAEQIKHSKKQTPELAVTFEAERMPAAAAPRPHVPRPAVVRTPTVTNGGDGPLPIGEKAVLIAIAQYPEGAERDQLTVLTGYKRSSRDTYIQRLGARGFIEFAGSAIRATQEGINALGADFEPLPTGAALREYWLARLPEGERNILSVLIEAHPENVERSALDERTGYKRSSRDTYLQRLGSRRLVVSDRGTVRASDLLFEERLAA